MLSKKTNGARNTLQPWPTAGARIGQVHCIHGIRTHRAEGHQHQQLDRVFERPSVRNVLSRGFFSYDTAVAKILWLAICDIEDRCAVPDTPPFGTGLHSPSPTSE